jgi:PucR C-terminal helix-turn-helix domain
MSAPAIVPKIAAPRPRVLPPSTASGLRRFVPVLPEIVTAVLGRIEIELPELTAAGWRLRIAESGFLHAELRRGIELVASGSGLEETDLQRYAAHFTNTATSGAPLLTMQRFCRTLIVELFSELWAWAEPGDVGEMLRFSQWLSLQNKAVEQLLVTIYGQADQPGLAIVDRRTALADRLLTGLEDMGPSDPDLPVAPRYLVVVLAGEGPAADRLPDGTLGAALAGLRHLLVPVGRSDAVPDVWEATACALAGTRATAVLAVEPARIPAAAASARSLLEAADAVGLSSGLIGVHELVLETALAGHPSGLRQVAALLRPIEADPRLRRTLTTFFSHDLDRTRTADSLQLSRSGLALRLARIAKLTGYDPRTVRGIQVLRSALSARAMLEQSPPAVD